MKLTETQKRFLEEMELDNTVGEKTSNSLVWLYVLVPILMVLLISLVIIGTQN